MNRTITRARRLAAIAAIALASVAGTTALAACGGSSEPATTPSATPSATATTGLPAPIIVDPTSTWVSAKVGDTIVFNQPDPANSTITTSDPDVVAVTPGWDDGSATFNPSGTAISVGDAVVTIQGADGTTTEYMVNVR